MTVAASTDVLVVGAGVAGLACARELQRAGVTVSLLERASEVGGRCASQALHGQPVDYAAPYLHGASPHFLGFVESLLSESGEATLLPGWPSRVGHPQLACQPDSFKPHQRRFAVAEGMATFPRLLARGLDIRFNVPVQLLAPVTGGVEAIGTDGRRYRARRLVLALAGPQGARLFEPISLRAEGGPDLLVRLSAVPYMPCLVTVAGYEQGAVPLEWDAHFPLETTILHAVIHDSTKRPDPQQRVLVLMARPRFSAEFLDAPAEEWVRDMVWEAGEVLGSWAGKPAWTWSHAWTWARLNPGEPTLESPRWLAIEGGGQVGFCGEPFFTKGGIEGAFLSGVGLARQLLET